MSVNWSINGCVASCYDPSRGSGKRCIARIDAGGELVVMEFDCPEPEWEKIRRGEQLSPDESNRVEWWSIVPPIPAAVLAALLKTGGPAA